MKYLTLLGAALGVLGGSLGESGLLSSLGFFAAVINFGYFLEYLSESKAR